MHGALRSYVSCDVGFPVTVPWRLCKNWGTLVVEALRAGGGAHTAERLRRAAALGQGRLAAVCGLLRRRARVPRHLVPLWLRGSGAKLLLSPHCELSMRWRPRRYLKRAPYTLAKLLCPRMGQAPQVPLHTARVKTGLNGA